MKISQVWTFSSDSNPSLEYETLQYLDGTTSCNCKGWTRRTAEDGSRSCKHTRYVDMGTANGHCAAHHTYTSTLQKQPTTHHAKNKITPIPKLGQRKFAV